MTRKQTKQSRKTARRKARQEIVFRHFIIPKTLTLLPKGACFSVLSEKSKFKLMSLAQMQGVI
jgi:hypothetical protein